MLGLELGLANTSSRPGNRMVKGYFEIYRQAAGGCNGKRETFNEEYVQLSVPAGEKRLQPKARRSPFALSVLSAGFCHAGYKTAKAPALAPRRRTVYHQG